MRTPPSASEATTPVQAIAERLVANVERVIIGKRREVQLMLVALLSKGHVLIEDVPGVGKTVLAKTIARSIGCTFSRVQFTPDLLPGDVTGVSIFNQATRVFEYRPGPIVAQIVLADEINRATPKTQSALLEAMEERQITVDGESHALPNPFVVMATQNPIEYEGTFPLPEAQLDRFLLRVSLGYPTHMEEISVLQGQMGGHPLSRIEQAIDVSELITAQQFILENVRVDPLIMEYIISISESTRRHDEVYLGSSPRGSLGLLAATRAWAALAGRDYVLPDDVKMLAEPVLAHRLIVSPAARMRNIDGRGIIKELLQQVPVPGATPFGQAAPRGRGGRG